MIASDQAAHHAHIAGGAIEFGFGCFEIGASGLDIFLGAANFGGHRANFLFTFLLRSGDLLGQLLIRGGLLLADSLGATASFGDFRLGHANFLAGNFDLAFEIRKASIGLFQLGGKNLVFLLGLG